MKALNNKVIVISGGTKGVGKLACIEFAKQGAKVVFCGRDKNAGAEILNQIKLNGSEGLFLEVNLENIDDCRKMFETAYSKYKRIDGFFNYAGITPIASLLDCDENTFDKVMNINFKSCFFCCQEAIKCMKLSGGGSIVITGSPHAWGGDKDRAIYSCSKGCLYTLMEHIAKNYGNEKIRCNYLTMGWTLTEGEISLREKSGESVQQLIDRASKAIPMGRMNECSDYIDALIYLMSDSSYMTTGSNIRVTGALYL